MFKIESYITPILLNYVAKYVKNIRPQDFQVSLWEGEVTFQNLDLRLDVLERELKLPFEFLSGHIHEMVIQVPWTKITSEPIRIFINTIEFVLKAKTTTDDGTKSPANSSDSPQHGEEAAASGTKSKSHDENSPTSTGLAMKIVNNINVQCQNIILKYIEEDIVVSMNVQLLNYSSANDNWKSAVLDINPNHVLMRKLINVSDLTICLDKRNSAGQIDVCQEPLLYRCTLECRILRKCDYHIGGKSSIMRIGIFTQALDLNFSSLQVPMLMRIIKILTSNTSEKPTGSECDPEEDEDLLSSHHPESAASGVKQSYLSWAWNLLPTFSIDDSYKPDTNIDITPGHTKDFGIYIEELNFTLKNSEFVNDTLMGGIKRIRYTPIVRFTFGGLYWERVVAKEVNWTSMRTGLSSIYVEPLGTFKSEHTLRYAIMETAPVTNSRSFIDKSLFDEKCKIADKGWAVTNYKDYISRFTDEYLMFRSPILAFDVITYRLPKCDAEKSTIYGSTQHRNRSSPTNEDYSKLVNLHKQSRLLSTGVTFRYNQTFLQVKNVIKPFIDSYDSATYSSVNLEKTDTIDTSSSLSNNQKVVMQQQQHTFIDMDNVEGGEGAETYGNSEKMLRNTKLLSADSGSPKLHPPMVEDYDSLMQGIPLCKYKIHLRRFRLEVYPKMEPDLGYTSIPKKLPISIKNTLPFIVVYFDDAVGSLSTPITPDKLVHTTCQLPDKPQELLDNCYNNYDLLIKDCSVNLICPFTDTTIRILTVPKVQSTYGSLLQAYHWKRDEVSTQKLEVQCEQLKLEFSKRELIAITQTIHCSLSYSPKQCMQLADALNQRPCAADTMSMNCNLSKIQLKQRSYHSFGIWNATVAGVQCELIVDRRSVQQQRYNVFASSARILHNNQQKWLEVQVQFPSNKYDKQIGVILQKTSPVPTLRNSNGTSKVQFEMALGIWMEKFHLNADKNLLDFFAFVPQENRFTKEYSMDAENATNNIQQQHNVPPPPPPSSAPSTSMVYQTASSLPQVFSRRSSRHSNPIRKISQPEETIHYSSERDDKVDYNTTEPLVLDAIDNKSSSAVQSSPAQNDSIRIQQYFKQFNSIIIYMELAQSHLNITPQQLSNRIGDNAQLKGEYTQISLPKITLKSSFADYITRSSLRLKVDPPLTTKTTFNWTINFQDLGITTYVNEQAYVVLQPWQTSLTVAMTKKKQAVLPPQSDIDYSNAPAAANIKMPSRINSPKTKHKTKYDRSKREPPATLQQDTLSISSASFEDIFSKESPPPTPPQAPPSSPKPSSKSKYNLETTPSLEKYHEIVCLNLHLDSSTIHISGNRINQTQLHIQHLMEIIELMELSTSKQKSKLKRSAKEKVQILNSSEENQFIKEFMDLETNSDISAMPINEKKSLLNKISIFCQWTIAKVIAEIENSQNAVQEHKSKIIMEIEDFLCTVDQGLDFTKYTSKMGNFNLNYLQQNPNKPDWLAPEHLRIRMIAEASDLPFVNLVLTSVNLRDFYKRIGVKRKGDVNRNINEIIITMQAMEIICNLQRIKEFVEPLCSLMHGSGSDAEQQHTTNHNNDKTLRIASQLPLVHFESKGITAYFPLDCEQQIQCTALIWKIDNIQVTPNLQNPLQRKPLRPDVFGKAASMGILSIPGSMIEDRQYELTLKQISAASGNWFDILTHMRNKAQTVHTNPAVEWNNPERKQLLKLNEIFKNFTLIVTYAPNIVFNNILICGQATEVNCSTDFIATLNTDQLKMLSRHAQNIQEIQDSFQCLTTTTISPPRVKNSQCSETTALDLSSEPNPATGHHQKSMTNRIAEQTRRSLLIRSSSQFESIDEDTELLPAALTQKADSGIHSTASSKPISKWQSNSVLLEKLHENPTSSTKIEKSFPKTLSFVAGIFLFKIYEIYKESAEAEEEEQIKQRPLLACTISQPSYMFTQNVYESVTHFSIFTLSLALPRATLLDSSVLELAANEFPDIILDTMCGELTSTGIPPSLFTYKIHQTKLKLREIDIEFAKPLLLKLNENYTSALCANLMCIYKSFYCNPVAVQHGLAEIPLHRKSKIMLMKRKTLNADRLNFRFQTFVFSLRDHCNAKDQHSDTCQLVFNDFKINLKYLTRPEKCCVKYSLAALHLKTGEQIFLHPISLKGSLDFLSEPWHSLPLVNAVIKFNVMEIDLSIHVLLQLRKALENLRKVSQIALLEWQRYQKLNMHDQLQSSIINHNKLRRITCPQAQRFTPNNKSLKREEFYQDDLRAGAFQFVELISDTVLPLPYQIQIIKKDYGIICWRYPQPRKMCKIHIFPVPMAVENPIHIKCRMEYFSEVLECFQHYCDFFLSETISKDIKLPERTSVCATIWRVVILQSLVSVNGECFDTSEEDEELQTIANMNINDILGNTRKDSDFILHPKVLVGCMRVDTIFQSSSVPKVQILLSCNLFKVKFLNEPNDNHELPASLKQIRLAQVAHTNISHEFLQFNIQNVKIQFTFYNRDIYNINLNTGCNIKVLDYGYLNMIPLMEDMTVQSYLDVNKSKNQLLCNVVCDRLKFNMGPAIIHTLLSSKLYWEECWLGVNNRIPKKHALLSKCVVVNRTESHLAFGQTGTHERLNLKPRECQLYSFRSDYHSQELTFYITDEETNSVESSGSIHIPFKFETEFLIQHMRLGNKCVTIKTRKLSGSQIFILIKGQIELVSMVDHKLRLEFRQEGKQQQQQQGAGDESNKTLDNLVENFASISFYHSVQVDDPLTMRLKIADRKIRARTGDIPLRTNKKLPWLVKVPISADGFISFWVRILREDIKELHAHDFKPQKILITIWPIFEMSSMLTCPLIAQEEFNNIQLPGEASRYILDVPATHLTEHRVNFQYPIALTAISKTEYILKLKSLDWHNFFWYDEEQWDIENALKELANPLKTNWPLEDEQELRIQRISHNRNPTDIIYNTKATREFSCALNLEISPWGMFINSTGLCVRISELGNSPKEMMVQENALEMLCNISQGFTIGIQANDAADWIQSLPIYLDHNNSSVKKHKHFYMISTAEPADIVILNGSKVCKFVLHFKIENNRKIFKLLPKIAVVNFSNIQLSLLPFAMDHKESITRNDIKELDVKVEKIPMQCSSTMQNSIGISLSEFHDINSHKAQRSLDSAFLYFVAFKNCDNREDISLPIPLGLAFNRKSLSIQTYHGSVESTIALVVSLIEHNHTYYLTVFEDTTPALLINNQTACPFFIAQTNSSENSKVSSIIGELDGKHLEWYHMIPKQCKSYYTPPQWYLRFPDVDSTLCNITLALCDDSSTKKSIKWSKPIRLDKSWNKFLHIPGHGDVKVIICDQHKIIQFNILYISQQMEFSVKDLRSRILTPQQSLEQMPAEEQSSRQLVSSQTTTKSAVTKPDICQHFGSGYESKTDLKIKFFIKELNFSLHTDTAQLQYMKREIISIFADDFLLAYDDSDDYRHMDIVIPNLQIDNQLFSTGKYDFPVILCAQKLYHRIDTLPEAYYLNAYYQELLEKEVMITMKLKLFEDEYKLHSIRCSFSPIRAYIEDAYITDFLDAIVECDPSNCVYRPQEQNERRLLANNEIIIPREVETQGLYMAEPLQLRSFSIESMSVLLSVHTSVRLYIALDHSPLSFSAYERAHLLTMPLKFGQSLGMHYLSGAIFGAGWVVGSLEILGSPSGLARSVTTGLKDFVSMPVRGLFRGPWGFFVGVTQGSASLLKNVTAGTVNSVTKLAASVARNLDRLSLDDEHIERTEALRRSRPSGFTEGFSQGMTGLGISMLGAIGGLAHHTLEAQSPVQVFTGLSKGLVGALTKPISGAAELLALAGQGMLQTVGFNAMPKQRSPSACRNLSSEPLGYRIWKLLPIELSSDQILFYHEITLSVDEQLKRGYALLTSRVFAITEAEWDKLQFALPIDKVRVTQDAVDKTLFYVHLIQEKADLEEDACFTNERIMNFLHTSSIKMTSDALYDLPQTDNNVNNALGYRRQPTLDWSFYINEDLGEHIMRYFKILNSKSLRM